MTRIIVTGGAGFIGSALCRRLSADPGAHLTIIDKLTYAATRDTIAPLLDLPNVELIEHDICDRKAMVELITAKQPDVVYHLAAETHVDRSITGSQAFTETNVLGTHALLDGALEYWRALRGPKQAQFRFIHVSTDEVYGSLGATGRFSETTPYDPSSPYSASKAASDHLARAWQRTYGLPVVISNCSNNYGPYQFPEKLIPLMILNAVAGKPLPVYGTGENVRDWLYVDDHVRALVLIAEKGVPGETYNVGGGNERTNLEIVEIVCALLDKRRPRANPHADLIEFVADRPGHDLRYAIDATKIETGLGWRATQNLDTGLAKTVDWYLQNEAWWRALHERGYQGERLGLHAPDTALSSPA